MPQSKTPNRAIQRSTNWMAAVALGAALTSAMATGSVSAAPPAGLDDLSRYCATCWRNARLPEDRWGDCTQEVFTRLLERVEVSRWRDALRGDGPEREEFLRAIDTVKKRTQRGRKFAELAAEPADRGTAANVLAEEWEAVDAAAERLLSGRQQRILTLARQGWSVAETADELGMSVERVSDEKYKAVRKLARELRERA